MKQTGKVRRIRRVFQVGIVLKAIDGIVELVAGVLLFFTPSIIGLIERLAQRELIEDPNGVVARIVEHYVPEFTHNAQVFAGVYLLSHGVVKIVLAVGLLKDRLWAYPLALLVFSLFIVYQGYRYTHTHSVFLAALTVLDVIIVWLTWHEWRFVKRMRA